MALAGDTANQTALSSRAVHFNEHHCTCSSFNQRNQRHYQAAVILEVSLRRDASREHYIRDLRRGWFPGGAGHRQTRSLHFLQVNEDVPRLPVSQRRRKANLVLEGDAGALVVGAIERVLELGPNLNTACSQRVRYSNAVLRTGLLLCR